MKHNCKQLLSVLLTLCMALSLLTVTAAAAEDNTPAVLYVNGVDMLDSSAAAPTGVTYSNGVLTLEDAALSTFHSDSISKAAGVIFVKGGSLTIRVKGDNNKITYADTGNAAFDKACGIYFDSTDLTIDGGGTLTVQNAADPNGEARNYYDIFEYAADPNNVHTHLTVNSSALKCEADNTKDALDKNICGIALRGTLTVNSSNISIHTRKTISNNNKFNEGLKLISSNLIHKLTGNTVFTAVAGSGNDMDCTGTVIGTSASLMIDEGAKLYSTGFVKAFGTLGSIVPADGAKLHAVAGTEYAATDDGLTELALSDGKLVIEGNGDTMKLYKTVEITGVSAVVEPEDPGEEPGEEPGKEPTVDPGSKPGEGEKPGDKPGEGVKPGDKPSDTPSDTPAETPSDTPADKPADSGAVKTGDAGISLYIGIAAVAVLGCGAVIFVSHKRKGD